MSSLDLHTHCGYQSMLPEAVAIVVAPTDARMTCGVFRLTTPLGLQCIQVCERTGFHPHTEPFEVYNHCTHVNMRQSTATSFGRSGDREVVDLRKR